MPTFELDGKAPKALPGLRVKTGGKVIFGGRLVDIFFIFDTTGSMDSKIQALIETCIEFVDEPAKYRLDPNFSLVSFGDLSVYGGGDRIEVVVPLTDNIEAIKSGLRHIPRNHGFGNEGESSLEAIQKGLEQQSRTKSVKVMILITDEPALLHGLKPEQISRQIAQHEYLFYALTPDIGYYKQMVADNKGEWALISATSNLDALKRLFKNMAEQIANRVDDVYRLTDGNVKNYKPLPPGR